MKTPPAKHGNKPTATQGMKTKLSMSHPSRKDTGKSLNRATPTRDNVSISGKSLISDTGSRATPEDG